ncbi:class I SAM-dependent methyltransferase [Corynebacterium mendelii]|uniref:Methyltransferase domain-containing protein n=1 Tax=Corynebacterium mendelii TaxID=2765362 RepID=A0A939E0H4_9CORY|nr:class I SAM-dependent methyltransferase [Corynebacterium mendelii]MBN9644201.1 methyltransferase domain-containing protein [Corynebacterium mendelii]
MSDQDHVIPGSNRSDEAAQGHWLLARAGKKVLRPGGRELTNWLLDRLPVNGHDVVEFAPGLGITAVELINCRPKTYRGVEQDSDAVAMVSSKIPADDNHRIVNRSAADSGLEAESADVVIGEAMLTMTTNEHKLEIMREAHRLLRSGGLYAIHELALQPDDLADETKQDIQRALARSIKVNARPLTGSEWEELGRQAGFSPECHRFEAMALLEPKRLLADEGIKGTATIIFNVLRNKDLRKRVLNMRRCFSDNKEHLRAIGVVFVKP